MILTLGLCFVLTVERQFKKKLKSIKTFEACLKKKNDRMISVHFQGKPFNVVVIQVYAPTSNADEAEIKWV